MEGKPYEEQVSSLGLSNLEETEGEHLIVVFNILKRGSGEAGRH